MQATVNSVLSPTSNTSSKSILSAEASKSSQGQFADDFNRAKQALDSSASSDSRASDGRPVQEQTNDTRQTASSTPSDSTSEDADTVQGGNSPKGVRLSENNGSNATGKDEVSGNRLQSEGESSPEENSGTDDVLTHSNSDESAVKSKGTAKSENASPHVVVSSGVGADSDAQLEKPSSHQIQSEKAISSTTEMSPSQDNVNSTQTGKSFKGSVGVDDHVANKVINGDSVEQGQVMKNAPPLAGSKVVSSDNKLGATATNQAFVKGQGHPAHLLNQNGIVQSVEGEPLRDESNVASNDVTSHLALKGQEGKQQLLDAKVDDKGSKETTSAAAGVIGEKVLSKDAAHTQTAAVSLDQNGQPIKVSLPDTVQLDKNGNPVKKTLLDAPKLEQNGSSDTDKAVVLGQGKVVPSSTEEAADLLSKANGAGPVPYSQKGAHADEAKANDASSKMSKIPPEVRALMAAENSEGNVKSTASNVDLSALSSVAQRQALASTKKTSEKSIEKITEQSGTDKKATKKSDDGELSWVLSQMGANPIAPVSAAVAGVAATARGASSTAASAMQPIGDQVSPSKVADQVALANALKAPVTGAPDTPLILANANSTTEASGLLNGKGASKASLLTNEPIELRKKEQDAIIGKMVGQQVDGATKDSDPGGMGSSLANNIGRLAATGTALGATNPAQLTPTQQQNLAMSVPPNHPGWAGEMSQKVAWVAHNGAHSAHIKLDPPELGSLTVKVSVDSDNNNTQVSFVAATHHARDLLEGQMGRLRDMLAQQGMDLGNVNVDVSQQDMSGTQYQAADGEQPQLNLGSLAGQGNGEEESVSGNMSYITPAGIDYYA